jgi:hypothetical protein
MLWRELVELMIFADDGKIGTMRIRKGEQPVWARNHPIRTSVLPFPPISHPSISKSTSTNPASNPPTVQSTSTKSADIRGYPQNPPSIWSPNCTTILLVLMPQTTIVAALNGSLNLFRVPRPRPCINPLNQLSSSSLNSRIGARTLLLNGTLGRR